METQIVYGTMGKAGTTFVMELASLHGESSALEKIALRAAMVMPILLLQNLMLVQRQ